MRLQIFLLSAGVLIGGCRLAAAEHVFIAAENKVAMAMVEVIRGPKYTEVFLQAQADFDKVCCNASGPNSPYLLAGGKRYRFIDGERISLCPDRRAYTMRDYMILRFEPLEESVHIFSLVEGEGGEKQMSDPAAKTGTRYWNFLGVKIK